MGMGGNNTAILCRVHVWRECGKPDFPVDYPNKDPTQ